MTSEELDTAAASLLGQTPIWPPKEGGEGEIVTVEGTLFTPQCDSLAVNLASLRREALIDAVGYAATMAAYFALTFALWHSGRLHIGMPQEAVLIIIIAMFVAANIARLAEYEFRLGHFRFTFDRATFSVISGANRQYGFDDFAAVALRWRGTTCVVSLLTRGDRADRSIMGRVRNWGRRRWLDPTVGRYAKISNARRVANAVAEIMGLEVVKG